MNEKEEWTVKGIIGVIIDIMIHSTILTRVLVATLLGSLMYVSVVVCVKLLPANPSVIKRIKGVKLVVSTSIWKYQLLYP